MIYLETTKKKNYFLEYTFPIEQLVCQNKFIWTTKMYFIFESKYRKTFSQAKQIVQHSGNGI